MEMNYVELTGRLHKWSERQGRNGVYGRGWIEVLRTGSEGTTKFPLVSFDPGGWEHLVDSVVTLAGHLVWMREFDDNGEERFSVAVHVNAMRFVRKTRAAGEKSSKRNEPVGARNHAKPAVHKAKAAVDNCDPPF